MSKHLYIFKDFLTFQAHISCDSEPGSVGSNGFIITRTNFVTLRYHTDSWGTNNNGFTLIITAFKNAQTLGELLYEDSGLLLSNLGSYWLLVLGQTIYWNICDTSCAAGCGDGFQCDSHICISPDLVCDNVSHCGHGQDEVTNNFCSGGDMIDQNMDLMYWFQETRCMTW